jgi:hypothetical protein
MCCFLCWHLRMGLRICEDVGSYGLPRARSETLFRVERYSEAGGAKLAVASVTALGAVQTAFAIAESGLLDGAQFWYNKALDVIWIATAPYYTSSEIGVPF